MKILIQSTEAELEKCFRIIHQLRPHLDINQFIAQTKRQKIESGYTLVFAEDESNNFLSVAGFRIAEFLAWGKILYVDDLVTDIVHQSKGFGSSLLKWLDAYARKMNCKEIHLDSGVQRFQAHRVYLQHKMDITCHHFGKKIS